MRLLCMALAIGAAAAVAATVGVPLKHSMRMTKHRNNRVNALNFIACTYIVTCVAADADADAMIVIIIHCNRKRQRYMK